MNVVRGSVPNIPPHFSLFVSLKLIRNWLAKEPPLVSFVGRVIVFCAISRYSEAHYEVY
jgi:hypothetical protein